MGGSQLTVSLNSDRKGEKEGDYKLQWSFLFFLVYQSVVTYSSSSSAHDPG